MKILVAEDDTHTRAALVELLTSDGHQCFGAADGIQATKLFVEVQPDLVCLDVMMPGRSGYDLCREFRRQRADVPIIFITAKSEQIDKVLGLELGGDDYIVKPFGCQEVLARVHAVARRSVRSAIVPLTNHEVAFVMDDLSIHPKKLRAIRGDKSFELTTREVQLLQLLHDHKGEVVTRELIFNLCWGYTHIPNSRTLDQMVSQLRNRIELDPKNPRIIQTVYGVGYRFDSGIKASR
jgi:DNA-binding response OmpR family regulator